MNHSLKEIPQGGGLYLKALKTASRKPAADCEIPEIEVRISKVRAPKDKLSRYLDLCGYSAGENLPITYPQVLAAPLHMWLMLRPEFPIPLLGIVHVRNHFEHLADMPADADYEVVARLNGGRQTHQGIEFDIQTEFLDSEGTIVHRSLMTPLFRRKMASIPRPPRPAPPPSKLSSYFRFEIPSDIGRRYGSVSGDVNPIHLSDLSAKMFGFKRAIAHGMWSIARCAAQLEGERGKPATELSVAFRQPVFLPAKVALKYGDHDSDKTDFSLLSRTSDKIHLEGSIR